MREGEGRLTAPVEIVSRAFGSVEVPGEKVVTFPEGLYGFEGLRRFALLAPGEESPWCCLQSLDDPDVCFVAVTPGLLFRDYAPEIPDGELVRLGFSRAHWLLLCLVSVQADGGVSVNARAPLVIDAERRLGAQVILPDERLPVRFPLPSGREPEGGAAGGPPRRGKRLVGV